MLPPEDHGPHSLEFSPKGANRRTNSLPSECDQVYEFLILATNIEESEMMHPYFKVPSGMQDGNII